MLHCAGNLLWCAEGVGDERLAVEVVGGVEGFVAGGFERGDGGVEFEGGRLFGGGVGVAEFAGGEVSVFSACGWAEGAAEDGAVVVEVAGAGGGVKDRAGLVVGVFLEESCGLLVFGEDASDELAGEPRIEAGEGGGDALLDTDCAGRVGLGEGGQALAEASGVLVGDGEDSDTALGAAGAADEVWAATQSGGGESGGDDLDQVVRHGRSDFRPLSSGTHPPGIYTDLFMTNGLRLRIYGFVYTFHDFVNSPSARQQVTLLH